MCGDIRHTQSATGSAPKGGSTRGAPELLRPGKLARICTAQAGKGHPSAVPRRNFTGVLQEHLAFCSVYKMPMSRTRIVLRGLAVLGIIISSRWEQIQKSVSSAIDRWGGALDYMKPHMVNIGILTVLSLCLFAVLSTSQVVFRISHILWRVHIRKDLPQAPRPAQASFFEWYTLGHSNEISQFQRTKGLKALLLKWSMMLDGAQYFLIWQGPFKPTIIVSDREGAKNILESKTRFQKGSMCDALDLVAPEGLHNATADRWHSLREKVAPCFHASAIESLVPAMGLIMERQMAKWKKEAVEHKRNVVDVRRCISHLSLSVMMKTTFGDAAHAMHSETSSDVQEILVKCLSSAMDAMFAPIKVVLGPWIYSKLPLSENRRFQKLNARLHKIVSSKINVNASGDSSRKRDEQKQEPQLTNENNFMQILVSQFNHSSSGSPNSKTKFTRKFLRDQLGAFVMTGHATTTEIITYCMVEVANHPTILKRLQDEADRVLGDGKSLTCTKVLELKYTLAVIKEALRMNPPNVVIAREATVVSDIVGHQRVAPGMAIWVAVSLLHHEKNVYPRPFEFDPNRWLKDDERLRRSYMPFSVGPRRCIGRRFALVESCLLLAMLAQRFMLLPEEAQQPTHTKMAEQSQVPRKSEFVRMIPRE